MRAFLTHAAENLAQHLWEFCYPGACAGCGELGATRLCLTCEGKLLRAGWEPACEQCGKLLGVEGAGCQGCLDKGLTHIERVARLSPYDEVTRGLILEMKFRKVWGHGEYLGRLMAKHEGIRQLLADSDLVIPIPLHRWRHWSRGFNQSEVLARMLIKESGQGILDLTSLKRTLNTDAQSSQKSATARAKNVAKAFAVRSPQAIVDKKILLLDDVMTTGATCIEAARELKNAGARSVSVAAVAVADRRDHYEE